jgi:Lrp/AsnC family transcriptional regulator, regulator for asnA, asnC and gidA
MARRPEEHSSNGYRIDDLDLEIIKELQQDGRRTYGRIGTAVGLSEAAVRQRVQRLVEDDAIKIVAVTNPYLLGARVAATIGIHAEGNLHEIAGNVSEIPEVDYVVVTAGSFDILAEAQCRDNTHLLQVLNEGIRGVPGVTGTETFVYLDLVKQTYPWPPN